MQNSRKNVTSRRVSGLDRIQAGTDAGGMRKGEERQKNAVLEKTTSKLSPTYCVWEKNVQLKELCYCKVQKEKKAG